MSKNRMHNVVEPRNYNEDHLYYVTEEENIIEIDRYPRYPNPFTKHGNEIGEFEYSDIHSENMLFDDEYVFTEEERKNAINAAYKLVWNALPGDTQDNILELVGSKIMEDALFKYNEETKMHGLTLYGLIDTRTGKDCFMEFSEHPVGTMTGAEFMDEIGLQCETDLISGQCAEGMFNFNLGVMQKYCEDRNIPLHKTICVSDPKEHDGGYFVGYITDEKYHMYSGEDMSELTKEEIKGVVEALCDDIEHWANGKVYGFTSYDKEGNYIDSFAPFYGSEHRDSKVLDVAQLEAGKISKAIGKYENINEFMKDNKDLFCQRHNNERER